MDPDPGIPAGVFAPGGFSPDGDVLPPPMLDPGPVGVDGVLPALLPAESLLRRSSLVGVEGVELAALPPVALAVGCPRRMVHLSERGVRVSGPSVGLY